MYYHMKLADADPGISGKMCCLAFSDDGIDWEPAPVDQFEVAGLVRNNVVTPGVVSTPFLDPQETLGCRFWSAGSMCERTEPPIWEEGRNTYFGGYDAVYLLHLSEGNRPCCRQTSAGISNHPIPPSGGGLMGTID